MTDVQRDAPQYRWTCEDRRDQYGDEYSEPGIAIGVELPEVGFVSIASVVMGCEEAKVLGTQEELAKRIVDALNAQPSESATPSFNDGLERAAAYVRSKPSEKREQIAIGILALKNATSQPQSKAACDPVGNVRIPAESASSSRCVAAAPRWTPVADGDGTAADQIAEPGEEITFYCLVRGDYYEYKITLPLFDERNGE